MFVEKAVMFSKQQPEQRIDFASLSVVGRSDGGDGVEGSLSSHKSGLAGLRA